MCCVYSKSSNVQKILFLHPLRFHSLVDASAKEAVLDLKSRSVFSSFRNVQLVRKNVEMSGRHMMVE